MPSAPPGAQTGIDIRPATRADDQAVLDLLRASMGWVPDEQHARFFDWKHRRNPHGESPAWVAVHGDRVVGFRTFLRWTFAHGEARLRAVRAVDTATHPDHQGQGIFSRLTRHALDELAADGVDLVFNTPNERSRPGYLKLGWELVGRLPVAARLRSPGSLVRLARARTPADKWSAPCEAGVPAGEALAGDRVPLVPPPGDEPRLRTARDLDHLRWRYSFPALRYRAILLTGDPADGLAIFRLRRRGAATEAAVCELLLPPDDDRVRARARRRLLGRVVRESGADHAVLIGRARWRDRCLPVPGQGPTLVWRSPAGTGEAPPLGTWDLTLGDVELF